MSEFIPYTQEQFDTIWLPMARRKLAPDEGIKVLGVVDPAFTETSIKYDGTNSAIDALTSSVDFTTYPDKARITITNGRGFDVFLTSASIHGKLIYQYSGQSGGLIHDSLRREDDIRRNGERLFEVGNEFIVDTTQCAKIADYWHKALGLSRHVYTLEIPGLAPWYEVGAWYTLDIGAAGQPENIDSTVECIAVECERQAGGIGTTVVTLREVYENWAFTTAYATRIAGGGSQKRRVSRSGTVVVAAAEYDGPYDYHCDGTDDEATIQAAIDYLSAVFGGGTVELTEGVFHIAHTINMADNIKFVGRSSATILRVSSASISTVVAWGYNSGIMRDMAIDGDSANLTITSLGLYVVYALMAVVKLQNISVYGFLLDGSGTFFRGFTNIDELTGCSVNDVYITSPDTSGYVSAFYGCTYLSACSAEDLEAEVTGGAGNASGIAYYNCQFMNNCRSGTIKATSSGGAVLKYGYYTCTKLTNCITTNAEASSTGFNNCKSVQQCKSVSNATHYSSSYADAGTSNACADTAAGGYNS